MSPASGGGRPAVPDALPLASLVLDGDANALSVNDAWSELTGLAPAEAAGRGWTGVLEPGDREELVSRLVSSAGAGGQCDCHLQGSTGGRWTRWWWASVAPGRIVVCVADIEADRSREQDLWRRATRDPLTGLINRAEFLELLRRAVGRRGLSERPAAVVFLDLDGLKAVNDGSGHAAGDSVLRRVGTLLAGATRPSDVAARLGGDEFGVLCEDLHGSEEAWALARRLAAAVEHTVVVGGVARAMSASVGVAVATDTAEPAEALLARADAAMYEAKRRRRAGEGPPVWAGAPASPGAATEVVDLNRALASVRRTLLSVARVTGGAVRERLDRALADLDAISRRLVVDLRAPVPPEGSRARSAPELGPDGTEDENGTAAQAG